MVSNNDILQSLSPALANDIAQIGLAIESDAIGINRHSYSGYKTGLIQALRQWPPEKKEYLQKLLTQGIRSLNNKNYWIDLEIFSKSMLDQDISVAFTRALFALFKLCSNQPALERIGFIRFGEKNISMLEVYTHSKKLGEELNKALETLKQSEGRTNETKANIANNIISFIKYLDTQAYRCKTLEGIYALSKQNTLFNKLSTTRRIALRTSFNALMSVYNPNKYEKEIIRIGSKSVNIKAATKLSPVLRDQLEKVSQTDHMRGAHGHSDRSNVSRLSTNIRTIVKLCEIDQEFSSKFHENGLDSLSLDNFSLLRSATSKIKNFEINELKRLYEIYSGKNIDKDEINEYLLKFSDKRSGHTKYINMAGLLLFGKQFLEDIVLLHKNEIFLNDQKSYSMETLHNRFSVLMKMKKHFCKEATNKHGLRFLSECDGKYQIELLSKIQAECINKSISRRTAEAIFSCIRWICQITNQPFINAYRITSNRHAKHAARLSTKDTYSLEEVRELAFYIEKSIANVATSSKSLLALYFARIQIKTCLNTASLIAVECKDIQEVDIPTAHKPITVLIQKPRKGYVTDHFCFDPKFPKSAIHDLLHVRDQLTSAVRIKFSKDIKSARLFIYEEAGQLKYLTNSRTIPNIARLLIGEGCSVKYNSAKLRKTGANEIYRQIAKEIHGYKDALKHSYETFLKHYHRINEAKTKRTLAEAASVMDKYFTGKEISTEIKIVTEYSNSTQLTPVGGCTSKAGSKEAVSFNKSHPGLSPNDSLRCGDFLACVWCKHYRIVADADHVWQLLSFKDYVIADMQSSTAHFPNSSIQKQAVSALNTRVDTIVNAISSLNPSAVPTGVKMIKEKGLHPAWEYAAPLWRPST